MLDPQGHFMESQERQISLIPTALLLLVGVAHMQFNQIAASISYEDLLELAILCDKYYTVTLIKPWIDQWTDPFIALAPKSRYVGKPKNFWEVLQHLVANTTSDSNGSLVHEGRVLNVIMPPGVVDKFLICLVYCS